MDELSELFGLIKPMYFDIFQEEVKPTKEEKKKRNARASRYTGTASVLTAARTDKHTTEAIPQTGFRCVVFVFGNPILVLLTRTAGLSESFELTIKRIRYIIKK